MSKEFNLDVAELHRQTPGCRNVLHFNNAGAALLADPVIETTRKYFEDEIAFGGYEAAARNAEKLQRATVAAAEMFNCAPAEIAILENATRAWQMAFYGVAEQLKPGDRILTANAEYASNFIAFLQIANRKGVKIDVVPNTDTGETDVGSLREMIDDRTKLIAITHVPTNGGLVNPAAEIGEIAKDAGVLYLLDACQSAGQLPLDVNEIQCDFMSTTGRKWLRAPRGCGLLYVSRPCMERFEPPILDDFGSRWVAKDRYELLEDARRFETFEMNLASRAGLGAALDYAMTIGIDAIARRVESLANELRAALRQIDGADVHDIGARKCGIVTFTIDGMDPDHIRDELTRRNINVWVSRTKSTRLDMDERGLEAIVRASIHYYNLEEEIHHFCSVLADMRKSKI